MRIFDCITFLDETDHLAARVELLDGIVDCHLVVEGTHTFQGAQREPFKALDGIVGNVSVGLADLSDVDDAWTRERTQRDFLGAWLAHLAEPDDLVLVCDVDEHPNPDAVDAITRATETGPVSLGMRLFYYGLEWEDPPEPIPGVPDGTPRWLHPRALRARDLPTSLSALRENSLDRVIYGAGWHISYTGDTKRRQRKLTEFSHAELNNELGRLRMANGPLTGTGPNGEQLTYRWRNRDLGGIPDTLICRFARQPVQP